MCDAQINELWRVTVRWRDAVARVQKSRRLEADIVNNDINERVQLCAVTSGYQAVPRAIDIPCARARVTRVYYSLTCQLTLVSRCPASLLPSTLSSPPTAPSPSHKLCTQRVIASASGIVAQMYTFHNLIASWCHLRAIDHPPAPVENPLAIAVSIIIRRVTPISAVASRIFSIRNGLLNRSIYDLRNATM